MVFGAFIMVSFSFFLFSFAQVFIAFFSILWLETLHLIICLLYIYIYAVLCMCVCWIICRVISLVSRFSSSSSFSSNDEKLFRPIFHLSISFVLFKLWTRGVYLFSFFSWLCILHVYLKVLNIHTLSRHKSRCHKIGFVCRWHDFYLYKTRLEIHM